jgi:hypothetical protein
MSLILDGTNGLSDVDGSAATPAIRGTDANTGIFFPAADTIAFAEGGAEAMRIDSSGNLGIGTTSPGVKLHVSGDNYTSGEIGWGGTGSGANSLGFLTYTGGNSVIGSRGATALTLHTNGSERARIDSAGNFGLGITPSVGGAGASYRLFQVGSSGGASIYSGSGQTLFCTNVAWSIGTPNYQASSTAALMYSQESGIHVWKYAAAGTAGNAITFTEAARITAAGNFLIGSTSDTNPLAVRRTSFTGTSRTSNVLGFFASNGNGADGNIQFTDAVANNSWFGQNNSGAYVVCNSGGVRVSSGSTSWASDSDERIKDIIEPIANATNKVSTLRAVIGKYKTDAEGTRRSFLIAQDVQAVLPEAVVAQPDEIGTLSLSYTEVIPLLVAAIKEQQAIIESLKARLDAANL